MIAASSLLVFAFATAGPAQAEKPCWRQVIDDWTKDSRLDKSYPIACYDKALEKLPNDIKDYTDAYDQISQARQAELRGDERRTQAVGAAGGNDDPGDGSDGGFIDDLLGVGSGDSGSIPIPLLILAGLAALLMAAGAAGLLARRLQARRAGPPEAPE